MTRTDALFALVQRQRRFEWQLARAAQTQTAAALVAGKTHDLLNLVQIVQLATAELGRRCSADAAEFITDLTRAGAGAQTSLQSLMAIARPEHIPVRGAPVGAVVTRVLDEIRAAVELDAHLAVSAETATALTTEELEHLLIGMALDARDAPRIELHVRDRTIDGSPWVEIVRGTDTTIERDPFELRAVDELIRAARGELAHSERRNGGSELVVALPAL